MQKPVDVHKVFAEYFKGCKALAYALSSKLNEGNICLDIKEYLKIPDLNTSNPFFTNEKSFLKELENEKYIGTGDGELKPFILKGDKAYLQRYFQYETQIIDNIKRLGDNFRIITGGPGTGKTYSVASELVDLFRKYPDIYAALAAPTGKAAARMNEAILNFVEKNTLAAASGKENPIPEEIRKKLEGMKASTIHRLLGYKNDSVFFRFNEINKLPFDIIIIDECSMIDGALMAKLLNAVGEKTKLYLLGDKDQLASVEAGSVFGDLCSSEKSDLLSGKIEKKEKSWRFDKDKGIGKFSKEVIDGTLKDTSAYSSDEQIRIEVIQPESDKKNSFREKILKSESFRKYAQEYLEYINEQKINDALAKLNRIRFLCVTKKDDFSVAETNKAIEQLLRTIIADHKKFNPRGGFYHNQPIIITQNDYKLRVFNGDVGLVRLEGESLFAYFPSKEGEVKKIPAGYLNHFETVFAMTIHKSQGSEFDHIVIILPEKHGEKLLTRELLYTGVTRAKEEALLFTTKDALDKCVNTKVSRASGLYERLNPNMV